MLVLKNWLKSVTYNIKADDQFVSNVNKQVKRLIITVIIRLEGENYELVERTVMLGKSNSKYKPREVKTQSKKSLNLKTCLLINTNIPGEWDLKQKQFEKITREIYLSQTIFLLQAATLPKDPAL